MGIGYFTAQNARLWLHHSDDGKHCIDLDQDGNFEWNGDKGGNSLYPKLVNLGVAAQGDYHYSTNRNG